MELPTPERLGGWLHTVEASKIQIVCRKFVRMSGCPSMVQLLHSNGFPMIFCFQFSTTARTLLDTKACLHHSSLDFAFRPKSGPRSSEYAATPRRSEWEVEINVLVELDRFQGFVSKTLILLCIFKSMETIQTY